MLVKSNSSSLSNPAVSKSFSAAALAQSVLFKHTIKKETLKKIAEVPLVRQRWFQKVLGAMFP